MCGRYANFLQERELADAFAIAEVADDARLLPPSWNIAPTQVARVVTLTPDGSARRLIAAHWGLVPAWAKDPSIGSRLFNARSETVAEKPAFRSAFEKRRCLVPANGYYEWQARFTSKQPAGKQPFYIHPPEDVPVAFAGLWETGEEGNDRQFSFTILTAAATGALKEIHDRQPVMLGPDARDAWLDPDSTRAELMAVVSSEPPAVVARAVGKGVGNVRNNGPELIEPTSSTNAAS